MKKYLSLITILSLACNTQKEISGLTAAQKSGAQKESYLTPFNGDTLEYFNESIIKRKEMYIGKELNDLIRDLKLPIINYYIGTTPAKNNKIVTTTTLHFIHYSDFMRRLEERKNPFVLVITWKTPLSRAECWSMFDKHNRIWTKEIEAFYGKQIVGDIITSSGR